MVELIKEPVSKFAKDIKMLFGSDLSCLILYGSYARGDYAPNSDIDIMILVKTSVNRIRNYIDAVADCAFDYLIRYGVDISPIIKNEEHFNYWADNLPFYRNVKNEGVIIDAG